MRRSERSGVRLSVAAIVLAVGTTTPTAAGAHGPPSPEAYRWVTAPSGIESAGEPGAATASYPADMFAGGFSTAWTPDVQASVLLTVPDGVKASDVEVTLEPLDANALAHVPTDFAANGNAYRISVGGDGWQPDVRVQLTTPYPATGIWAHDIKGGWRSLSSEVLDSGEALAEIQANQDGVTVVASWIPPSHSWWQKLTHSSRNVVIAAVFAGGAGWAIGNRRPTRRTHKRRRA